jgi:dihydroxyacetone kinase-like predicted kinase
MITLYYGEDVDETAAKKTADELSGVFPGTEISVVYGGQPVYYYMISIE